MKIYRCDRCGFSLPAEELNTQEYLRFYRVYISRIGDRGHDNATIVCDRCMERVGMAMLPRSAVASN